MGFYVNSGIPVERIVTVLKLCVGVVISRVPEPVDRGERSRDISVVAFNGDLSAYRLLNGECGDLAAAAVVESVGFVCDRWGCGHGVVELFGAS